MLQEKTMVADALAGINGELTRYGEMIAQTENKELKTTLKQKAKKLKNKFNRPSGRLSYGVQDV